MRLHQKYGVRDHRAYLRLQRYTIKTCLNIAPRIYSPGVYSNRFRLQRYTKKTHFHFKKMRSIKIDAPQK